MKKHLPTISVVIPAHNEESTIFYLLSQLSKQKQLGYSLEGIYVICDGCTDRTEEIALKAAQTNKFIHVLNDKKRKGKAHRLNEFYKESTGEISINFDADVQITDPLLISKLIVPFKNKKVGLVGGSNMPTTGKTFVQKALSKYDHIWKDISEQIRDGHNVHNNPGCISAVRTSLVKNEKLPKNLVADDHYMYFAITRRGHLFRFAKDAIVYYQVPSSLQDFFLQTSRFFQSADDIETYFGNAVEVEYSVPKMLKMRVYLANFIKDPFWLVAGLSLQLLQRVSMPLLKSHGKSHFWQQIRSSKQYV